MATIKTELTTQEFIKLYGDNQYVRSFSQDAIECILDNMSKHQESSEDLESCDMDWTAFFMDAGEMDAKTVVNDYSHTLHDHAERILDMSRDLDGLDDDLVEELENNEYLSDSELLTATQERLELLEDWIDGVAEIIADERDFVELSGGRYLDLGC